MKTTKYNILVVDDDIGDRQLIQRLLSRSSERAFNVLESEKAQERNVMIAYQHFYLLI